MGNNFLQKEMQCYQNTQFRHETLDGTGQCIVAQANISRLHIANELTAQY